MSNMRIWDALKTTDPRHTKEVGFGRKFTSIDAQWQLQRMTEQFGPVGEGWTWKAVHSIERIAEQMVLAVCDVTIYWRNKPNDATHPCFYGPVRATSEIWSPDKSNKMRLDDDAPKKAMTDALTKGLSHLGLSADVFLGMYDDNKYVQKLKADFARKDDDPDVQALAPADAQRDANGELLSTYSVDRANKAKDWADSAISVMNLTQNPDAVKDWRRMASKVPAGKRKSPLEWLRDNSSGQYLRVRQAYQNATGEDLD